MNRAAPRVSVVIPLFDEEEVFCELLERIKRVVDGLPGGPHQLVMVNDGSRDRTGVLLDEASARDERIVAVHLSRNFGHQAGVTAGLDHANGDYVVVMDGDLQDPPEVIPMLLAKAEEGYDVVYATRVGRKEGWLLRISYYLAYRLIAALASVPLALDAGDFGVISRRVADELRRMPERHRFVRGLRAWVGFRQVGLEVERAERRAGRSKYSLSKLLGLAFNGIFAFSVIPLRLAAAFGAAAMAVAGGYGLWAVYAKIALSRSPQGFTGLIVVIVFLAGVQLLSLGVIGEYVGRLYEEAKRRPVYVVDRVVTLGSPEQER